MKISKKERVRSLDDSKVIDDLVLRSKDKGFVTYDELNNSIVSSKNLSIDDLEDAMSKFSAAGIDIIDDDSGYNIKLNISEELSLSDRSVDHDNDESTAGENLSSTDDPVRLYLRDMGGVELLTREKEINIAKSIDAGKALMLNSLCESPMAMKRLIKWFEDLVNEKIMLRDLIDLDANIANEDSLVGVEGDRVEEEVIVSKNQKLVGVQDEGSIFPVIATHKITKKITKNFIDICTSKVITSSIKSSS
jgi:RNA polymerase primary sigma factor